MDKKGSIQNLRLGRQRVSTGVNATSMAEWVHSTLGLLEIDCKRIGGMVAALGRSSRTLILTRLRALGWSLYGGVLPCMGTELDKLASTLLFGTIERGEWAQGKVLWKLHSLLECLWKDFAPRKRLKQLLLQSKVNRVPRPGLIDQLENTSRPCLWAWALETAKCAIRARHEITLVAEEYLHKSKNGHVLTSVTHATIARPILT